MPWGLYDTDAVVEHDEELDPFRNGVAEALDESGVVVGYVATSVSASWELVGWHWWRPRWGRPIEVLDILYTPVGASRSADIVHLVEYAAEWGDGATLWMKDRELRLRWLAGDEATQTWERYGWDRPDVNQPPA